MSISSSIFFKIHSSILVFFVCLGGISFLIGCGILVTISGDLEVANVPLQMTYRYISMCNFFMHKESSPPAPVGSSIFKLVGHSRIYILGILIVYLKPKCIF